MTDLIAIYAERMRAAGRSPYTISTRCRVLRHADRTMPHGLDEACGDDIVPYLAAQKAAWSQATCYGHLAGYYRTMVAAGHLTINPTEHVDRPAPGDRLPNPVSDEELTAAITQSPDQPWRAAVILAAYAGLRCCELVALDRVDVTEQHVHIRRGKGGKGRYVPTHPAVWDLVKDRPAGPIVVSTRGGGILAQSLTSTQSKHWRALGMPTVHMHRFRHWFGTTLCDQGVGIDVVSILMGHASIATTQGYVRVSVVRQKAAMNALPVMGGPASS